MYKVIHYFNDLQDDGYAYNVGDEFPHTGMTVTKERIAELTGRENKQGVPLIAEVKPKRTKRRPPNRRRYHA